VRDLVKDLKDGKNIQTILKERPNLQNPQSWSQLAKDVFNTGDQAIARRATDLAILTKNQALVDTLARETGKLYSEAVWYHDYIQDQKRYMKQVMTMFGGDDWPEAKAYLVSLNQKEANVLRKILAGSAIQQKTSKTSNGFWEKQDAGKHWIGRSDTLNAIAVKPAAEMQSNPLMKLMASSSNDPRFPQIRRAAMDQIKLSQSLTTLAKDAMESGYPLNNFFAAVFEAKGQQGFTQSLEEVGKLYKGYSGQWLTWLQERDRLLTILDDPSAKPKWPQVEKNIAALDQKLKVSNTAMTSTQRIVGNAPPAEKAIFFGAVQGKPSQVKITTPKNPVAEPPKGALGRSQSMPAPSSLRGTVDAKAPGSNTLFGGVDMSQSAGVIFNGGQSVKAAQVGEGAPRFRTPGAAVDAHVPTKFIPFGRG
jgi:hypothetical protein